MLLFNVLVRQEECRGCISCECDPRPATGSFASHEYGTNIILPHEARQHLVGGSHKTERKRIHGVRVPSEDV